jgi:hypothetical protein
VHACDCACEAMDLMFRYGGSTSFKTESRLAEVWRDLEVVGQAATLAPEWYPIGGRAFLGLEPGPRLRQPARVQVGQCGSANRSGPCRRRPRLGDGRMSERWKAIGGKVAAAGGGACLEAADEWRRPMPAARASCVELYRRLYRCACAQVAARDGPTDARAHCSGPHSRGNADPDRVLAFGAYSAIQCFTS